MIVIVEILEFLQNYLLILIGIVYSKGIYNNLLFTAQAPPPYYVSYVDKLNNWYPPKAMAEDMGVNNSKGCNFINLAFWIPDQDGSSAPADVALVWSDALRFFGKDTGYGNTTKAIQANLRKSYHMQNTKVMVWAFGSTSNPTTSNIDPTAVGRNLALFVIDNQLDGVDLDYEDDTAMDSGTAVPWLINMTTSLLKTFQFNAPGQKFFISHAPQAPYFINGYYLENYVSFYNASIGNGRVGDYIDFFNVQFYNQGSSDYLTYKTLFVDADGWSNDTAVAQIVEKGIPIEKIVVGKLVTQGDASNTGYVPQETLSDIFKTARQGVWSNCSNVGGVMNWQFASDTSGWMKAMKNSINC